MMRIGEIWNDAVAVADARVMQSMEAESYAFHRLLHMTKHEPKERIIDYADAADKLLLQAVHKVLAPRLAKRYHPNTYSSIQGRGLTQCAERVKRLMRRYSGGYYVQVDIKKYYQSIPHVPLKASLRRYIKDKSVLRFLDAMIDNHDEGIAIGLSLSSYVANLYLTDVDRWLESEGLDFVRYMDDIVVWCHGKGAAHDVLRQLRDRIEAKGLKLKENDRVAPVDKGLSLIGYKFWPTHTLLRRNIREAIKKRHRWLEKHGASDEAYKRGMASYFGWMIHADCRHFMRKTMGDRYHIFEKNVMKYDRLTDKRAKRNWFALPRESRVSIRDLVGKDIVILAWEAVEIFKESKAVIKFCYPDDDEQLHFTITRSGVVMDRLKRDTADFPALVTIVEKTGGNGRKYICYE